jgi:short subunit dehydrogenase
MSFETDEATWDRAFAVNVKSMYLTCHYGVPHLINRGGSIIAVSSVQADFEHAECLRLCDDQGRHHHIHAYIGGRSRQAQNPRQHDLSRLDPHADAGVFREDERRRQEHRGDVQGLRSTRAAAAAWR